ncbi:MarR family transcriptional regulator [Streptomyces olivaceoviridis]
MTTPDPEGLLAEQLLRLTRRVHRIQKRHLEQRDLGVTPAQSRLLRTLAHYGSPPRMTDLAERLEVVPRARRRTAHPGPADGPARRPAGADAGGGVAGRAGRPAAGRVRRGPRPVRAPAG